MDLQVVGETRNGNWAMSEKCISALSPGGAHLPMQMGKGSQTREVLRDSGFAVGCRAFEFLVYRVQAFKA